MLFSAESMCFEANKVPLLFFLSDTVAKDTRGADSRMKCLLERLNHMKSSRKLLVGKLREGEESNRRKSRRIAHFEREEKESKVSYPFSLPDVKRCQAAGA